MAITDNDDIKHSLLDIADNHHASIVSLLLNIQKRQELQKKSLGFVKHLECFYLKKNQPMFLYRCWINGFEEEDYVALSYTWSPADGEDTKRGCYNIHSRNQDDFYPTRVRNCVFDRVLNYMETYDIKLLWIDRHSIKQPNCNDSTCNHRACRQKQKAVQTMDLVYKQSKHPVALLARPIKSKNELNLLARLLKGELVDRDEKLQSYLLSQRTSFQEARDTLNLLYEITNDLWWKRAWTFQEDYRAGKEMILLIPNPDFLKGRRQDRDLFDKVPGELYVRSVDFSREATKLCLAFQYSQFQAAQYATEVKHILHAAGKYTVLLKSSESMSPYVIADIESRDVAKPWDRLAIIANCCQYAIRMDTETLKKENCSLSLSILAMCLLNGEILRNGKFEPIQNLATDATISEFIKAYFFNNFCAPQNGHSLTFNKGCRFINVSLQHSGIHTQGHLWKLEGCIHIKFSNLPYVTKGNLPLYVRKRLTQLATKLRALSHKHLADRIDEYLYHDTLGDSHDPFWKTTFSTNYLNAMAIEVVSAIESGKPLRLGRIWSKSKRQNPCTAIFIWEGDENGYEKDSRFVCPPAFAFTASQPKKSLNDIDRHVSLEIEFPRLLTQARHGIPNLYVKRWLPGLCFFCGCRREDVCFPWPPSLEAIVPLLV